MWIRATIPILILVAGVGAWKWLGEPIEEPQPEQQVRKKLKTERLVLKKTDYQLLLKSQGTVRPHHRTTLTPLVAGRIIQIHPGFEDGAFFRKGEVLAEIDPSDLKADLTSAQSRLARAEATLARETAQAKQAKLNWDEIGYEEEPPPLVLRIPQLKEANAMVSAAQADVEQAQRNLERAKIRAPFDGRVESRRIGLGQAVNATTPLGDVFATDLAEVRLPLTPGQIPYIDLPIHEGDAPVAVTLTDALGSHGADEAQQWQAEIIRTEGTLDERSRELFVIARVMDPFGLRSEKPELRIGQPVRAEIRGRVMEQVFVIPRTSLRGVQRIYLIDPVESRIRKTDIVPVWSNEDVMLVRDGIEEDDWLAISRMPYAPDGAPVDIITPSVAESPETTADDGKKES